MTIIFEEKIEWSKIGFSKQVHHVRMNSFKHFSCSKTGIPAYVYAGTDLPIPDTVTNLIEKTRLHNFHNGQDFLKIEIKVVFKTDCKWTISELTPNQVTMPFTTKMGDKTYQGERKFLDDSMIETSYIAAKPTVVTFKRVK